MIARRILPMLLILGLVAGSLEASLIDKLQSLFKKEVAGEDKTIKVLLAYDLPGVMVETKGKYCVYDPRTDERLVTRFAGKRKFIQPTSMGLRWGEDFQKRYQLKFVPESPQGTVIVDGIEYKGIIYVYAIHGKISVVNEVSIENYVTSLLSVEYNESLSHETLAAIAIAARTRALYLAENPRTKYWAIEADHVNYVGYAVTTYAKKIEEIVSLTERMVMSKTAAYEGVVTPFPAQLSLKVENVKKQLQGSASKLSVDEMETLAKRGEHAAQILTKAFPESSIQLIN